MTPSRYHASAFTASARATPARAAIALLFSLMLAACSADKENDSQLADYVFSNGRIYTVTDMRPWAEAVAVRGNEIFYVGSSEGVAAVTGDTTETIDLQGAMLLPGFVSGHDHLVGAGWMAGGVQLYQARSKVEYLDLVGAWAKANPEEKVVFGVGWNRANYGAEPTAAELDEVVSLRPAILLDATLRNAWLNSKALAVGGVDDKETLDPVAGVGYFSRDADKNPTGMAYELAWLPVYLASGAWEPQRMIRSALRRSMGTASAAGITSVLNPGVITPDTNDTPSMFAAYQLALDSLRQLDEDGALPLRVFLQPTYRFSGTDAGSFAAAAADFSQRYDSDRLRSFGIKIYPEDNWISRTAAQLAPYADSPGNAGAAAMSAQEIRDAVLAANSLGLDAVIHVKGSATVRSALDAIEASGNAGHRGARNALHHLSWVHPDDLLRIMAMHLGVNVTPLFSTDWSGLDELALQMLGEERSRLQLSPYPLVFNNGNRVSLSADVPGSPFATMGPLFSMEAAMTQQNPLDENSQVFPPGRRGIRIEHAIKGVTLFPAWQIRMENKIGTIEVGKYADLVVLDQDLFDVDPRDIAGVKVLATMMGGKYTYLGGLLTAR